MLLKNQMYLRGEIHPWLAVFVIVFKYFFLKFGDFVNAAGP